MFVSHQSQSSLCDCEVTEGTLPPNTNTDDATCVWSWMNSEDALPPHTSVLPGSSQVRSRHHLQPAEGAALVATSHSLLETPHPQSNRHLIGPRQAEGGRHGKGLEAERWSLN